jgi:hypothetical protein
MKVRITGNKIRLRIKEPEVQHLYKDVSITETLEFGADPEQQLQFRLETYEHTELGVTYQPGRVVINLPKAFAETLALTGKIGYEGNIDTGDGATIFLLIEKDFECLDAPEEDNAGSYPNPKQTC